MKKFIALTLTGILLAAGSATAIAATAAIEPETSLQTEALAVEQNNLYLVPGTYISDGEKVENVISSGATKLTEEQCAEIYTDNAYLCTLSEGQDLPKPESTRKDREGNSYTFNGWWSIVDATVTYFETVPELSETTYLYADWRADLSQRKDPVEVDESTAVQPEYYMSIVRGEKTETVALYVSGTDASGADKFGFGAPVQFYNEWFELCPGDEFSIYIKGLGGSDTPQVSPIPNGGNYLIQLESSAAENNNTADYLNCTSGSTTITYIAASSRHYRIYVKFYDDGETMTVYMQPQE